MTRRRWAPVFLVVAALVVVGLAAQGAGVQWGERESGWQFDGGDPEPLFSQDPITETSEEPQPLPEPTGDSSLPDWVTWVALAVLIGVPALLLLFFLARRVLWWLVDARSDPSLRQEEIQRVHRDVALVEQAVEAGLTEIDLGTDPRSAIIACWVHFESASEAVGITRDPSDTPSDLVRKLLEHHELEGSSLLRLSEAYLRARYSPHEVDEADRDSARDSLIDLQRQLGVREGR
ncbi:hypothetical protein GCM10027447_03230 [Glycomyces halotolerans]